MSSNIAATICMVQRISDSWCPNSITWEERQMIRAAINEALAENRLRNEELIKLSDRNKLLMAALDEIAKKECRCIDCDCPVDTEVYRIANRALQCK